MEITLEQAMQYFRALWPIYTHQPLAKVEAFDFAPCGFTGWIGWIGPEGFEIVVDSSKGAERAFYTAMHELGHVVKQGKGPIYGAELDATRQAVKRFREQAMGRAVVEVKRGSMEQAHGKTKARREWSADGWGHQKAATAWSVLRDWGNINDAVRVMRWVELQNRGE